MRIGYGEKVAAGFLSSGVHCRLDARMVNAIEIGCDDILKDR